MDKSKKKWSAGIKASIIGFFFPCVALVYLFLIECPTTFSCEDTASIAYFFTPALGVVIGLFAGVSMYFIFRFENK